MVGMGRGIHYSLKNIGRLVDKYRITVYTICFINDLDLYGIGNNSEINILKQYLGD